MAEQSLGFQCQGGRIWEKVPNTKLPGDCAVAGERLYKQAVDAKEEHRKYCKMSEKSAELLRRAAKKNGGGRTDLQAQQTSTRDVTQATFKKMLKRLKYEMKECTFKLKMTWKECQR